METKFSRRFRKNVSEEAEQLLCACKITRRWIDKGDVMRALTPDFVKHLQVCKEKTRAKNKQWSEMAEWEKNGFLTLSVLAYLRQRGFPHEFRWNFFVQIVAYLKDFLDELREHGEVNKA